jgi:hypothetical protein
MIASISKINERVKENPLTALSGTVGTLAVIVGAVLAVDARYVKAGEIQEFKVEHTRSISQLGIDTQTQINMLRKQQLEDKVFELQLIPPQRRSDVDRARLDKYQRDLEDITRQIRQAPRAIGIVQPDTKK